MYGRDPWGGPLEINTTDSATDDDRSRNLNDFDRAALSRPLDETQQSWLLGPEEEKKKKYVDLGCISVSRKIFVWTVGLILAAGFIAGIIALIVKIVPRHHEHPPPADSPYFLWALGVRPTRPPPGTTLAADNYTLALQKALMFFNAQKSGRLTKHNNVSWRGNSCLNDSPVANLEQKSTWFLLNLVGEYYDAGDTIKFHFPKGFVMTMLSWSVIEYSAKYKAAAQQVIHSGNNSGTQSPPGHHQSPAMADATSIRSKPGRRTSPEAKTSMDFSSQTSSNTTRPSLDLPILWRRSTRWQSSTPMSGWRA
ncbi:hypothetical protein OSB04_030986 [Centaurea solstitialis]|uniref:cellulase n=1 Tax=Centaurea solstitialis TaxID=347529 RepID=A0AA38STV5_9ASTR|nr:hypothetical protein OSB04_030986 [Centaurea solstitialis]